MQTQSGGSFPRREALRPGQTFDWPIDYDQVLTHFIQTPMLDIYKALHWTECSADSQGIMIMLKLLNLLLACALISCQMYVSQAAPSSNATAQKRGCNTSTCVTHRLADFLSRSGGLGHRNFVPTNVGALAFGRRRRHGPASLGPSVFFEGHNCIIIIIYLQTLGNMNISETFEMAQQNKYVAKQTWIAKTQRNKTRLMLKADEDFIFCSYRRGAKRATSTEKHNDNVHARNTSPKKGSVEPEVRHRGGQIPTLAAITHPTSAVIPHSAQHSDAHTRLILSPSHTFNFKALLTLVSQEEWRHHSSRSSLCFAVVNYDRRREHLPMPPDTRAGACCANGRQPARSLLGSSNGRAVWEQLNLVWKKCFDAPQNKPTGLSDSVNVPSLVKGTWNAQHLQDLMIIGSSGHRERSETLVRVDTSVADPREMAQCTTHQLQDTERLSPPVLANGCQAHGLRHLSVTRTLGQLACCGAPVLHLQMLTDTRAEWEPGGVASLRRSHQTSAVQAAYPTLPEILP
ncbi:Calcitonin gene-related peptide [Liparis tanakae]|uniref:Calcitonin gene-related peptide n=1 Tax=Liparis tanakae TaxID=230148 RepID=A0A4Z2J8X8_9TELE|nr:Calcitonin gene-related peptide [Liparis tanakae]